MNFYSPSVAYKGDVPRHGEHRRRNRGARQSETPARGNAVAGTSGSQAGSHRRGRSKKSATT